MFSSGLYAGLVLVLLILLIMVNIASYLVFIFDSVAESFFDAFKLRPLLTVSGFFGTLLGAVIKRIIAKWG